MPDSTDQTWVSDRLTRLQSGDQTARKELLEFAINRLEQLAHVMLRGQFGRLGRWVDTSDVFQSSAVRLWRTLGKVIPESPLHFHRLAALQVRLELLDLARQFFGPQGMAANHHSWYSPAAGESSVPPGPDAAVDAPDPARIVEWAELHTAVKTLPDDEAAVTDLMFYQGLSQEASAALLGVDVRTVQRRWQRARRKLGALLAGPDGSE